MEFKTLLKSTSFLAGTRVIQFLTGLVRIKLIAYFLGTLGTGLVDQLSFVTQKMSQFTLLSMSEAVVKQIAENKSSPDSINLINSAYKSYIILIGLLMLVSCTLLYLFSGYLTVYVFGDISYLSYFYIGLFSFPVLVLDSIPFSILKAFKDVKTIAKARIIIVIVNLILAVPLILIFKLDGAIAFVPLSYLVNLLVNFIFAKNNYFNELNINISSIISAKFSRSFLRELLVFSTFGITVGVFVIISEFVCRAIIISKVGVDSLGLYSPVIMWASMITGFILPSFSTYLYPRFCEIKSNFEISSLLNDGIRLGTFAIMPLLFIGIPYKKLIIPLFYSNEFLEASLYLPFHFIGVIFYVWWYVFSQAMTPTGRIKQHGIFFTFYLILDIIVTYVFVNEIGLYGWMLKHIVSPFVFFWIYYIYANISFGFNFNKSNFTLMLYLLLCSLILISIDIYLTDLVFINLLLGPIFLFLVWGILKNEEKKFFLDKLSLKRKN